MVKKTKVTLTIDEEVIKNAKQIGLNISQFCENALKNAIKALKPSNSHLKPKKTSKSRYLSKKRC